MNFNKLFRKFKRRLLWETTCRAALWGIILSAASVFLLSLFYHFLGTDAPGWMLRIVCPIMFLTGLFAGFLSLYPTNSKTAARIDETGLQERISTMLEFRERTEEIHRIQRTDALVHLEETKPSRLKFLPLGKEFLTALICILAALIITHIPYNILRINTLETGITQEQLQIIEDLIAELKAETAKLSVKPESRDTLNQMIDRLKENLTESESDLELVAHIEDARQLTKDTLQPYLSLYQIGDALRGYELTFSLGESISFCDGNAVSAALLDLQILLSEDNSLIPSLSETTDSALLDSGVSSEDKLFRALNQFAVDLLTVSTSENIYRSLTRAVDTAEEAILSILASQADIEYRKNLLDNLLAEAKDRLLGINPDLPLYQAPTIDMPESSGGEITDDEMPEGDMSEDGQGDGEGESGDGTYMIEEIYDPVSGNVSYREVFAVYYAEYLKALEAGKVPPDLQEIIDQYFSTLDQ